MSVEGLGEAPSPEVIIRSQQDPADRVRLLDRRFPDEYGTTFRIEAEADGLHARLSEVTVFPWDRDRSLADFLNGLAADFRGWTGERRWQVHCLALRASFHSGGHVELIWTLRARDSFQGWDASITTWIEAGEQMSALAAEVGDFLARS